MKQGITIFDMDETLVTSDFTWASCAGKFLARQHIECDESLNQVFYESGVRGQISVLRNTYGIDMSDKDLFESLSKETYEDYRFNVSLKEHAHEVVDLFKSAGYFTCILSANSPTILEIVKNRFSEEISFDAWFSTRNYPWSKGDPKVYDLISGYFGMKPKQCILMDDASYAIRTAQKMGIQYIQLIDSNRFTAESECDNCFTSLKEAIPHIKEMIRT